MSYARPPGWRLIGTAHSRDLARVNAGRHAAVFATADWSNSPDHGYWDAWWALSQTGRLALLAQVVDYEGTVRRVDASPPSLVVDPPGQARPQAVLFGSMPEAGPQASWLGFAWQSDAQIVDGAGGPVSARAWIVAMPYWFITLLGVPLPLFWLRVARHRSS